MATKQIDYLIIPFQMLTQTTHCLTLMLKNIEHSGPNTGLFIERFFGGQLRLVASEALSFLENP